MARSDSQATPGHGAFGWMHGLIDHHIDLDAMGKIVTVSRQVPIAGRMEYSAQFKANRQAYVRAFVRTQESPQTEDGHLDERAIILGFCWKPHLPATTRYLLPMTTMEADPVSGSDALITRLDVFLDSRTWRDNAHRIDRSTEVIIMPPPPGQRRK